jgi:diguanylate cyclase (GGDEF)-like protein
MGWIGPPGIDFLAVSDALAAAVMEPDAPHPLVLACDHRGAGLATLVQGMGTGAWRVVTSASVAESLELTGKSPPDVLLIDPLVEGGQAEIEELMAVLERDPERDTDMPGIVLLFDAARPQPAMATAAALRDAAFDALPRGDRPDELRMRIERVLAQCARAHEIAELRHRAMHDDGTGLLRPNAFQQRLGEHFGAAARHRLDLALVLVDLDHFGMFNKRFDHTVGDKILARVSEAIRASLRAEDVAGRIGGDEFAVLLPYTKKVEAAHVARRLLEKIRDASGRYPGAGSSVQVTASLGFETFDGADIEDLASLRAHAEIALRAAKQAGGDRGVYFRSLRA